MQAAQTQPTPPSKTTPANHPKKIGLTIERHDGQKDKIIIQIPSAFWQKLKSSQQLPALLKVLEQCAQSAYDEGAGDSYDDGVCDGYQQALDEEAEDEADDAAWAGDSSDDPDDDIEDDDEDWGWDDDDDDD
jgi:hypothetical protein